VNKLRDKFLRKFNVNNHIPTIDSNAALQITVRNANKSMLLRYNNSDWHKSSPSVERNHFSAKNQTL